MIIITEQHVWAAARTYQELHANMTHDLHGEVAERNGAGLRQQQHLGNEILLTLRHTVNKRLSYRLENTASASVGREWLRRLMAPCHWLNLYSSKDLTGHVLRHSDLIVHDVLFSRADYRGRGRHGTLVADLAGDVSLVCNFASEDRSLPLNRD